LSTALRLLRGHFILLRSRGCVGCLALVVVIVVAIALRIRYIKTIPEAPIYTNSTLISQSSYDSEGVFYPWISSKYESSDSPEKIIQFYSQDGTCELSDKIEGRYICKGKATPFGDYMVYIDSAQFPIENQTPYTLEIQWEKGFILTISI
jgi:hypothetical protein